MSTGTEGAGALDLVTLTGNERIPVYPTAADGTPNSSVNNYVTVDQLSTFAGGGARPFVNLYDYIPSAQIAAIQAQTSSFDCSSAMLAAIAALPADGGQIWAGPGKFVFNSSIQLTKPILLCGVAAAGVGNANHATQFQFPANTNGIVVGLTAAESAIQNLYVVGVNSGSSGIGIWCLAKTYIQNVRVNAWKLDGIRFVSDDDPSADLRGSMVNSVFISGCLRNAIIFDGAKAGRCVTIAVNITGCGFGLYESSDDGNLHLAPEVSACTSAPYTADGGPSLFDGAYRESGQPSANINYPSYVVNGQGVTNIGDATQMGSGAVVRGRGYGITAADYHTALGFTNEYEGFWAHNSNTTYAQALASFACYGGFKVDNVTKRPSARFTGIPNALAQNSSVKIEYYSVGADNWATALLMDGVNFNYTADSDNVWDLGTAALRYNEGYIATLRPGNGTVTWTSGAGSPEGVVTAVVGSLFLRTDGGASTTLYVKESGSGNTGWIAK